MDHLNNHFNDIVKLEKEVERLEEELDSYDIQKLMIDDVKFSENKIQYFPKEIKKIIDIEFKKLRGRVLKQYEENNCSNT